MKRSTEVTTFAGVAAARGVRPSRRCHANMENSSPGVPTWRLSLCTDVACPSVKLRRDKDDMAHAHTVRPTLGTDVFSLSRFRKRQLICPEVLFQRTGSQIAIQCCN